MEGMVRDNGRKKCMMGKRTGDFEDEMSGKANEEHLLEGLLRATGVPQTAVPPGLPSPKGNLNMV